ncbi:ATP-dependent DNA helicase UvrD2 [Ornithinimicrobium cryptoxanthini]|uniref:ATP-dependent DNA helicase UvrD2 n=1 Tax=Ornithinimicrobium cryptoxanthini TaxID=2934161 RepID=UPI002117EE0B|nr:ATP-dependent DNA helicase UvrD2 [Ornithinimicrobium cryptoxanthini]
MTLPLSGPATGVPGSADDILRGLDPEQHAVAATPTGPMCVLAGAGTGKTRAITHRIAYGVWSGAYQPHQVLAVTFTARAAGEMRTRLRGLGVPGVQARTFHAAALRQLQYFWPQAVGGAPPDVVAHKAPAVAEAAGRLRLRLDRPALRDLASEIEWAKVNLITPQAYPAAVQHLRDGVAGLDLTAVARVMSAYEDVKGERHVIDFEDVLLLMVGVLDAHPRIAASVRDQYRHFVVDEYQDVNPVQQQLLELWAGGRDEVCVVGDPAQTIYSFTGASPKHLLEFPKRHPDATVVRLVRNYRSTPQIVQVANLVLGSAARGGVDLQAQREAGPAPTLTAYPDDVAEAAGVAAQIRKLVDAGTDASEIAVLFRTNAQSEAVESALARQDVPYLVRGGERFFSRPEVRQAIVLLRGAARGDSSTRPLGEVVRDVLGGVGWSPQQPAAGAASRERWESLQALANLSDDLAAVDPEMRIPGLVAELDRRAAEQHAPTVQGVTLASLHAAKGLEWEVVCIIGCSEGLLPVSMAEGAERIEEERRLLYVGLTRARRTLLLSWAAARGAGGRAGRSPSRFLRPAGRLLGLSDATSARTPKPAAKRAPRPKNCRTCGTVLGSAAERKIGRCAECPPTYDEATFERLRDWRLATSRDQDVPAFVVFTDATLTAIAESGPTTLQGLADIAGVGPRKLELYGADVLTVLAGQKVDDGTGKNTSDK